MRPITRNARTARGSSGTFMATREVELQGYTVKELKRRARELGVPGREIDELDAADDIKTAAIQLVLRHDKALADLTAELEKLTVKELKKRAKADGASACEIEDLDDAADIKAAAIGLIVKLLQPTLAPTAAVIGKPVVSDKGEGGRNDDGAADISIQPQILPAVQRLLADANLEAFGVRREIQGRGAEGSVPSW